MVSNQQVIDVKKHHGARGDGSSDDASKLQKAIEEAVHSAARSGGTAKVYFPAGTYFLGSFHLQLSPDGKMPAKRVVLEGAGAGISKIVAGDVGGGTIYDGISGHEDITIRKLTFDGGGISKQIPLALVGTVKRVTIEDCVFRNVKENRALVVGWTHPRYDPARQAEDVHVRRCRFELLDCGHTEALELVNVRNGSVTHCILDTYIGTSAAFAAYGYCQHVTITDNQFLNSYSGDIFIAQSDNITIARNVMHKTSPTYFNMRIINTHALVVEDNDIEGGMEDSRRASEGIIFQDFSGDTFDNNKILYADTAHVVIRNNRIRNTLRAISVPAHSNSWQQNRSESDIVIEGNTIENSLYSAIAIGSETVENVRDVTVRNNTFAALPGRLPAGMALIDVRGNPGFAPTTMQSAVQADPRPQTVSVASTTGIAKGQVIDVDSGDNLETIEPIDVGPGEMRVVFKKNHAAGVPLVPSRQIGPNGGVSGVSITGNRVVGGGVLYPAVHVDIVKNVRVSGNDFKGLGVVVSRGGSVI